MRDAGRCAVVLLLAVLCAGAAAAYEADWSDCSYELDRLRRAARDAAYEAEQAEYALGQVESSRDELESCLSFPDIYDLLDELLTTFIRQDYDSVMKEIGKFVEFK